MADNTSSGAVRAGRAFVEIFADSTKLQKALKDVEKKFKEFGKMVSGWGKEMMAAGTAILAPISLAAHQWADSASALKHNADMLGMSTEALSKLGFAASMTRTDMESLVGGIGKMEKFLGEAANGSAEATNHLARLGVSMAQLQSLTPDQQFLMLAEAMASLPNQAAKAEMAMAVFGRGGNALLPMLTEGRAGIEAYMKQAQEFGFVLSGPAARAAEALHQSLLLLEKAIAGVWKTVGSAAAPVIKLWVDTLTRALLGVRNFIKENKDLVIYALEVGAALFAAGVAVFAFGQAIVWGVGVLTAVGTALSTVWGLIAGLGSLIGTVVTSPLLATLAVVLAAGAAFIWLSGVGGTALRWLGDRFAELKAFAGKMFRGIADALVAGDIKLAAEILWAGLKLVWMTGTNKLSNIWFDFSQTLVNTFKIAVESIRSIFDHIVQYVAEKIIAIANGIDKLINSKRPQEGMIDVFDYQAAKGAVEAAKKYNAEMRAQGHPEKATAEEDVNKVASNIHQQRMKMQAEADKRAADAIAGMRGDVEARDEAGEDAIQEASNEATNKHNTEMEQADKDLKDQNDRLNSLLAKASLKRALKESDALNNAEPPKLPDFAPGVQQAEKKTFGTFSAMSASASAVMGGGTAAERTAKNTEQTAKNTEQVKNGIGEMIDMLGAFNGPAFQ